VTEEARVEAVSQVRPVIGVLPKGFALSPFGQLDEINFGDSRFALEYDAVAFNATDRRVFVFFAANGFEVLGKRE